MPSLHDQIFAAFAAPVQSHTFDETVTHRPSGAAADSVSIDATFILEEPSESTEGGRHNQHRATIRVNDTLDVTFDDTWVINDVVWSTTEIGKASGDGKRDIGVETISPNIRQGARERI